MVIRSTSRSRGGAQSTAPALRGPQSAAPATKSAPQGGESTSRDNIKIAKHSFRLRGAPMSENEPHVQNSRLTAPATKSELAKDLRHVQSAPAAATTSAHRRKTTPVSCTYHKSRLCTSATISDPSPKNLHDASLEEHSPRPTRFCELAQSKNSKPRGG